MVFLPQFRDQYAPEFGSIENDWQKVISIAAPNSSWWYSGNISTEEEYTGNLGWGDNNELPKPSWTDLENIFYDQYIYGFGGEIILQKPELNILPLSETKIDKPGAKFSYQLVDENGEVVNHLAVMGSEADKQYTLEITGESLVDGFNLDDHGKLDRNNLTILDRWVLSKLHILIKNGKSSLDNYDVASLVVSFDTFIEELSNWYVRRSRRRFWKSEDDQDKFTAYATLYHVLVNSIKCIAPVLPFCTEKMYENLVVNLDPDAPESVHLCDYPLHDESLIDQDIIQKVDALKRVVELGRSARNQSKVKIRQPLSKVSYAIENDETSNFIDKYLSLIHISEPTRLLSIAGAGISV